MNAFSGRSGKVSMMRVMTACVVGVTLLLWTVAQIKCWCTGCAWVPMDAQTVALVLGALAAKAGQAAVEPKTTNDIPRDKGE